MRFLIDENMPRTLARQLVAAGHQAEDVRDAGLAGCPDSAIYSMACALDALIVTRDRGFAMEKSWPAAFTSGVILLDLPDTMAAAEINARVVELLAKRSPRSLLGAVTIVERHRALSRVVRRR